MGGYELRPVGGKLHEDDSRFVSNQPCEGECYRTKSFGEYYQGTAYFSFFARSKAGLHSSRRYDVIFSQFFPCEKITSSARL